MNSPLPIHDPERWLFKMFEAQAAQRNGVIRRAIRDVEARIGRPRLELEVRKRGFHLLECGGQFIIVCDPNPLRVIC